MVFFLAYFSQFLFPITAYFSYNWTKNIIYIYWTKKRSRNNKLIPFIIQTMIFISFFLGISIKLWIYLIFILAKNLLELLKIDWLQDLKKCALKNPRKSMEIVGNSKQFLGKLSHHISPDCSQVMISVKFQSSPNCFKNTQNPIHVINKKLFSGKHKLVSWATFTKNRHSMEFCFNKKQMENFRKIVTVSRIHEKWVDLKIETTCFVGQRNKNLSNKWRKVISI